MMRSNRLPAALLSLALGATAAHARASVTFPEALRKQLGLAEIAGPPPGCQLCHRDDAGGLKTATKPLGRSLLQAGTMGGSVPSLQAALSSLESDGTDSDRDGVGDVAELKAGSDPNVATVMGGGEGGEGMGCVLLPPEIPLPETGCSWAGGAAPASGWLTLAGLVALALRRRRSGSR
jgi:MYXO-CTERM domain-containing protein